MSNVGACKSSATMKTEADRICSSKMFQLAKLSLERPCGMDSYAVANYVCCAAAPPPPPPPGPMCFDGTLSTMGACKDEMSFRKFRPRDEKGRRRENVAGFLPSFAAFSFLE